MTVRPTGLDPYDLLTLEEAAAYVGVRPGYALNSPFIREGHDHAVIGVVCRPEPSPVTPKTALVPVGVPVANSP